MLSYNIWLVSTNNIYPFPINADQPTISKSLNRVRTYQGSEIEEKFEVARESKKTRIETI